MQVDDAILLQAGLEYEKQRQQQLELHQKQQLELQQLELQQKEQLELHQKQQLELQEKEQLELQKKQELELKKTQLAQEESKLRLQLRELAQRRQALSTANKPRRPPRKRGRRALGYNIVSALKIIIIIIIIIYFFPNTENRKDYKHI